MCLYLGLRRGEALGLKWEDVDLDAGTLKVRRTLKEGTRFLPDGSGLTRPVCDEPKTKSSRREIPLPQPCVLALHRQRNRLKALRLAAGSAWQDSGFVFTNPLGGAVYASSVYQMFVRFTRSCGLRYVRIHDLRHTTAVLMLENEVPLEAVGQVLGQLFLQRHQRHLCTIGAEADEPRYGDACRRARESSRSSPTTEPQECLGADDCRGAGPARILGGSASESIDG